MNPYKRTAVRGNAQKILSMSSITESRTIKEPLVPFRSLVGFQAFSKVGREAPVRTEPLPTIRVRFIPLASAKRPNFRR